MKKLHTFVGKAEMYLAIATLIGATMTIFAAALFRAFNYPLNWSLDLCLFLFAWCVFLSADVALRKELLVCFDLITRQCGPRFNRKLAIVTYVILTAFLMLFVYYGLLLCWKTRKRPFQGIPSVSYMWLTLSAPVGGALMLMTTIRKMRNLILGRPTREIDDAEMVEYNAAS